MFCQSKFDRKSMQSEKSMLLKAKVSPLREWYSCRGSAVVINSGVSTSGFNANDDSYSNNLLTMAQDEVFSYKCNAFYIDNFLFHLGLLIRIGDTMDSLILHFYVPY